MTRTDRINYFRIALCRADRAIRAGRPHSPEIIAELATRATKAGLPWCVGNLNGPGALHHLSTAWANGETRTAIKLIRDCKAYAQVQALFTPRPAPDGDPQDGDGEEWWERVVGYPGGF